MARRAPGQCYICGGSVQYQTHYPSGATGIVCALLIVLPAGTLSLFIFWPLGIVAIVIVFYLVRSRRVLRCQQCRAILANR